MRQLKFKDTFTVSRILKKMKIKPDVKDGITQEEFGAAILFKFIENLGDAEEEVTAFLADLKGIKSEELSELDMDQFGEIIEEFKNLKGLQGFFMQVGKLMQ